MSTMREALRRVATSPAEPADQAACLRAGERHAGLDVAEPELARAQRDEDRIERYLHRAERHRRQRQHGDAPVRSHQRQPRAKTKFRRSDDFASVGKPQLLEPQDGQQGTCADRCVAPGRSERDRDRGQDQRAADGADLVAGLAHREHEGAALGGHEPRQQRRACRRLRSEGKAEAEARGQQGGRRAERSQRHAGDDRCRAQARDPQRAEARNEAAAPERGGIPTAKTAHENIESCQTSIWALGATTPGANKASATSAWSEVIAPRAGSSAGAGRTAVFPSTMAARS